VSKRASSNRCCCSAPIGFPTIQKRWSYRLKFDGYRASDDGRPSVNALQNYASPNTPILYFVFDVMVLAGRDVKSESLESRRKLLERRIVPKLIDPVRYTGVLDATLRDLVHFVKAEGLEGLVAKRRDSRYQPGLDAGAWMKMRINRGQKFVLGGYTVGTKTFSACHFRIL
jgi:ATP-dependent DNA ligase